MSFNKRVLLLIFLLCLQGFRAQAAELTEADKKQWLLCIKRVQMKPPCCGACKLITRQDSMAIWSYLTGADESSRQGKNREIWLEHKDKLLAEFKQMNPERYRVLYSEEKTGGLKQ